LRAVPPPAHHDSGYGRPRPCGSTVAALPDHRHHRGRRRWRRRCASVPPLPPRPVPPTAAPGRPVAVRHHAAHRATARPGRAAPAGMGGPSSTCAPRRAQRHPHRAGDHRRRPHGVLRRSEGAHCRRGRPRLATGGRAIHRRGRRRATCSRAPQPPARRPWTARSHPPRAAHTRAARPTSPSHSPSPSPSRSRIHEAAQHHARPQYPIETPASWPPPPPTLCSLLPRPPHWTRPPAIPFPLPKPGRATSRPSPTRGAPQTGRAPARQAATP